VRLTLLSLAGLLFLAPHAPAVALDLEVKDASGSTLFEYAESHALVVWAGNYRNPFWKKLNNIAAEASQVEAALRRQGFQVTVVANPTGEELQGSIGQFIQRFGFKPNNRLVVYFAGHGWTRSGDLGYLVPVDAPDSSSVQGDLDFARRALSMEQILSWSKQMEAKHVLFVFDSCFSGAVFKVRSASRAPAYLERKMSLPVRQFLTAGDANEVVPAQSLFTPLLIRGLDGAADLNRDGYITGSELGDYLPQAMSEYTTSQNPQYGKIRDPRLDEGDIVFRSPGSSASPVQIVPSSPPSTARPSLPPVRPKDASLRALLPSAPPQQTQVPLAPPSVPPTLLTVSAESIVGPSAAVAQAREKLPQGATEKRNQCRAVNVAGTDHHRCTIWYSPAPLGSASPLQ
jgi:hypothetical protein